MQPTKRSNDLATVAARHANARPQSASVCLEVVSNSAAETQLLGQTVGRLLQSGDLLLLQGQIGAGKTCLTQGIARGMELTSRVTSPSFTLANVYEAAAGGIPLYHLDLWRIASAVEALGIGLDEYLAGDGVCVVEWPDVAESVLPTDYIRIRFEIDDDRRRLEICPVGGARPRDLVERIGERIRDGADGFRRSGASRD